MMRLCNKLDQFGREPDYVWSEAATHVLIWGDLFYMHPTLEASAGAIQQMIKQETAEVIVGRETSWTA